MAEWASISLTWWLSDLAFAFCLMLFKLFFMERFFACSTFLKLFLFSAFFSQMRGQGRDLDDLTATWTISKHETKIQIVRVQLLSILKFLTLYSTELAFGELGGL